jgi:Zn-dependent M16 (insulinase) family peptidase
MQKLKSIYHGFRLESEKWVEELHSAAKIFYHEKSGARLFYLENDDDNKVFSVTFRTPPKDSTGVAHIIEHSVLCGSRKYPVKEPFVELVKGSLNTFLNAMTFPDKTMYPVASRNDKDFRNLMDVYLDAVFHPNIYSSKETLMQEGWHYDLKDTDAPLTYKGVVYNEMKGAFSSPDALLEKTVFEALFPETTYGVESGGDPDMIPTLTWEQFLQFHRQYYHPVNSYIFLYGKLDILDHLKFLDEEYLCHYDKIKVDSQISEQPPFGKRMEKTVEYPIATGEETKDKTLMSLNFVVGKATDQELSLAFQMLEYMLLETPAAPLKKALTEAGIGKDVAGTYVKSILQPSLGIVVNGSNPEKKDDFAKTVFRELERLVKEGFDDKLIQAVINIFEFTLREADFGARPKGLIYNIKCMDSWLYDENPLLHLEYEPVLTKIKNASGNRYFETLIEQHLLQNQHQALVVLKPKPGLAEEKAQALRTELAAYKETLSSEQLSEIVAETKKLKELQETPDSQENLATIPLLKLTDITKTTEKLTLVEKREGKANLLYHPLFTNGIAYVDLYFNTGNVAQADVPYLYLLAEMLGKISTRKYGYAQLSNEINIHTGGIQYDVKAYTDKADDTKLFPKFIVKAKALTGKVPQMMAILQDIVLHSDFRDMRRLQELVQEIKANWDINLFRRGQQVASSRVLSYLSPAAWYSDMGLFSFYQFICELEQNWTEKSTIIADKLATIARRVFHSTELLVSVTMEESHYAQFAAAFNEFYTALDHDPFQAEPLQFQFSRKNEGLMTSGKVQYVVKGANFCKLGFQYHGSLKVLETILRYDYLWNRIRVQGGAYGGFAKFERNGNMVLGSYRDPNLVETLAVYDETAVYLEKFSVSEREMVKYIIGTISQLDMPLTAQQKGERATANYIKNITWEDICEERDQILSTRQNHIRKLADLMTQAMNQEYLCVLGSEQKIREHEEKFGELISVFK